MSFLHQMNHHQKGGFVQAGAFQQPEATKEGELSSLRWSKNLHRLKRSYSEAVSGWARHASTRKLDPSSLLAEPRMNEESPNESYLAANKCGSIFLNVMSRAASDWMNDEPHWMAGLPQKAKQRSKKINYLLLWSNYVAVLALNFEFK